MMKDSIIKRVIDIEGCTTPIEISRHRTFLIKGNLRISLSIHHGKVGICGDEWTEETVREKITAELRRDIRGVLRVSGFVSCLQPEIDIDFLGKFEEVVSK